MKITRLLAGERAPDTADRVHINKLPNGKHGWTGTVGLRDSAVFGLGKNEDRSFEEAKAEAIEWARQHAATELLIETDSDA